MSKESLIGEATRRWAEELGELYPHTRIARRLEFSTGRIETRDGTLLAQPIRVGVNGMPNMVRMALPNLITAPAYHEIRRALKASGVEVITIPRPVLDRTEARQATIVIVDTIEGRRLRADTHLFRATVEFVEYEKRTWRRRLHTRQSYFLTGYDTNERGLSYFFCELPPGAEPETIPQAYQALRPQSVVHADAAGVKVKRQGDMFFIRMKKGWAPEKNWRKYTRWFLHESNHLADQAILADGLTYVQGIVRHAPDGRAPDHHRLNLGRRYWWLCVGNTVPIVG